MDGCSKAMTPAEFRTWRELIGLNRVQAAEALELGRNQPQRYEAGIAPIPRHVALACAALARGIGPWPE